MSAKVADAMRGIGVALRGLLRRPAFLLLTVSVIGVGLGATMTVFTVVDHVLLRPLPYPEPEDLVAIGTTFPGREWQEDNSELQRLAGFSMANYQDWLNRVQSFEALGAYESISVLLSDPDRGPTLTRAARVDAGFFEVLGVEPALGRFFAPEEYRSEASNVIVLSHDTWVNRFGSDPGILGNPIPNTPTRDIVIGVLPPDFRQPAITRGPAEFWAPLTPDHERYLNRGGRSLTGIGRLADGVGLEAARDEMRAIAADLAVEFPDGNVGPRGAFGSGVNPLHAQTTGAVGRSLKVFLGAAFLLLLVAALNAANLFLVRGLHRQREIHVRMALGAGASHLARHVLSETVLLAGLGGVLGVALAYGGVEAFRLLGPSRLPRMAEIAIDGRILLGAVAFTLTVGVVTGLLPAVRAALSSQNSTVRGTATSQRGSQRFWWVLVGGQVALSLVILVGASLLMQSFLNLRAYDPGFDPAGALTFRQSVKSDGTEPMYAVWDRVLGATAGVQGLGEVAGMSNLPYQDPNWAPRVLFPGEDPETLVREGIAGYVVTPNFTDVMGTPVLQGRGFTTADGADGASVALVNEAFVRREMEGQSPLGATIILSGSSRSEGATEVVGVVGNVVQRGPEQGEVPAVYFPYTQVDWPGVWVMARSQGNPTAVAGEVRRAVADVTGGIPLASLMSMEDRIAATRTSARFNAVLFLVFGSVALVLSGSGLFGALSYLVRQRTSEIGIRMALGADVGQVIGLVVRQGLAVTGVGVVVGVVMAWGATEWIGSFLFGVEALDVRAFAVAAAGLAACALAATALPARTAARVDPVESLGAVDS